MGIYTLKQVSKTELPKLLKFIDCHWKKNHALVISNDLINFQHLNGETYSFLIAENNETLEFDALVGFIPTSQYDSALSINGDYWGAIWKIRDDIKNEEINIAGFALWKKIFKLPYFKSYAAIGISDIAKKIYLASRLNVSYLNHYYLLNNSISDFKIAKNVDSVPHIEHVNNNNWDINWIEAEMLSEQDVVPIYRPKKSITYLINRYAKHPIYTYRFLGIYYKGHLKCILVTRDVNVNGAKSIRIIDALGKVGGNIGYKLESLLRLENAEYIDFLNYGIPKENFFEMGFNLLDFYGSIIIPNYFEPFEQRNVKIELAYKADFEYVAFKGDSDQDRPNVIIDKQQ